MLCLGNLVQFQPSDSAVLQIDQRLTEHPPGGSAWGKPSLHLQVTIATGCFRTCLSDLAHGLTASREAVYIEPDATAYRFCITWCQNVSCCQICTATLHHRATCQALYLQVLPHYPVAGQLSCVSACSCLHTMLACAAST